MNTGQKQWTEDELARAIRMVSEGFSGSQIATSFGNLTRNAVIGRLHRAGFAAGGGKGGGQLGRKYTKKAKAPVALEEPVVQLPPPVELPALGTVGVMIDRGCKFIHGDPLTPDFQYCGHPVSRRSYCAFHHDMMFTPTPKPRRASRGARAAWHGERLW